MRTPLPLSAFFTLRVSTFVALANLTKWLI
jgi:hypothetical protein